ncbi:hypothetical protein J1D01_07545 [Seonamhaeicola sp. NFXS20]|uniref:hypothetical protein n=2 Tax=unclassified Seonamhaeicola TaxID=2622645 RepID=UPI003B8E6B2E
MSKLISILLSGFILMQSFHVVVQDFLQIDEFLEHAQYHKQEYGDNFFVFLSKHYGKLKLEHSKNHQEEQNDHEQLPFQCQGHCSILIGFIPFQTSYHINTLKATKTTKTNFHYLNLYVSLNNKELLHPPRQA